jgi:hypothetical protein
MYFEIIFRDRETGQVTFAITNVTRIRYITPIGVGYDAHGESHDAVFHYTEKLEVDRLEQHILTSEERERIMREQTIRQTTMQNRARRMQEEGYTNFEIAIALGVPESSVRAKLEAKETR